MISLKLKTQNKLRKFFDFLKKEKFFTFTDIQTARSFFKSQLRIRTSIVKIN